MAAVAAGKDYAIFSFESIVHELGITFIKEKFGLLR